MKGYSRMRRNDAVFNLLENMGNRGVRPTEKTLHMLMSTCAKTGDIGAALSFFDEMRIEYGVQPNTVCYNSLLKVCAKGRNLRAAKAVLEDMATSEVNKDIITLTMLINVYAVCCNKDNAKQYLEECKDLVEELDKDGVKANVVTFNTLMKLCRRGSLTTEAFELLDEMKTKDLSPDIVTYATLWDGISKNETLSTEDVLRLSSNIVEEMKKEGLQLDAQAYTVLMNLAFRTKDLNRVVGLFHEMKELGIKPTVENYGSMIKYYSKLGDPSSGNAYLKPCLDLMKECGKTGNFLESGGYTSLLSACANVANLEIALETWNRIEEQKAEKSVSMYNAMINVCLIADAEDKAFTFFDEMKTSGVVPNDATFRTFITHFMKKKDSSGAQRSYDEMKSLGLKPDRESLKMLKGLRVS